MFFERKHCNAAGDVQVDVFRVPDALEKEPQVAASLDREGHSIRSGQEQSAKLEVKVLDHLLQR